MPGIYHELCKGTIIVKDLKFKTPFIYALDGQYYVLGMHIAAPYTAKSGIAAYKLYKEQHDFKSFKRVIDLASVAPHKGDVDEFLASLSFEQTQELEKQFKDYLKCSSFL